MTDTKTSATTSTAPAGSKETVRTQIIESLADLRALRAQTGSLWLKGQKAAKETRGGADSPRIGFVPTMGALHQGHLELVKRAKADCDVVVVSIFVNPFQFAPHEDFGKYPRTFENDLKLLSEMGCDLVFYPSEKEIYPRGKDSIMAVVPPSPLNDTLEGAFRPTFFRGVATVVLKLFNLVQPHVAFFGEKDYQQLQVVKALVEDLDVPVEIIGVPTVRETDGLAMSSRNAYLGATERTEATSLYKALSLVKTMADAGKDVAEATAAASLLLKEEEGWTLQYLSVCHGKSLAPLTQFQKPYVIVTAAKLGEVRLIDNIVVP